MKTFAFVFPGQGSQAVGMLDGWAGHPAVVQALQEASDALGEDVPMTDTIWQALSAGTHRFD